MCLAAIAHRAHPRWRLVIAANRDEYHAREADPLAFWADGTGIIGGRDRSGGGTWLGLTQAGRLALVTNHRLPGYPQPDRPSRGQLVTQVLATGVVDVGDMAMMNPCHLLVVDGPTARILSNHPVVTESLLAPGLHGLSNGAVAPPWTKTSLTVAALARWLNDQPDAGVEPLFTALRDARPTAETWLDGGPEPRLSSPFIQDPVYGTRCSTLVLVDQAGRGRIIERRFAPGGALAGENEIGFRWPQTR